MLLFLPHTFVLRPLYKIHTDSISVFSWRFHSREKFGKIIYMHPVDCLTHVWEVENVVFETLRLCGLWRKHRAGSSPSPEGGGDVAENLSEVFLCCITSCQARVLTRSVKYEEMLVEPFLHEFNHQPTEKRGVLCHVDRNYQVRCYESNSAAEMAISPTRG